MKRILFVIALLAFFASPAQAEPNPLYERLSRAREVKVFVKVPTDSGASKLDTTRFQKALEEALKARKSIHFTPVATETEAQLIVETDIKGFMFSLTDPVDMLAGVGMAAMDAAKNDHFAAVDMQVRVMEKGSRQWEGAVHASLTEETMTEPESREKILDRAAQLFVREAFGKSK